MNQHPQPLTPEKLLERVLRVADLLTTPPERNHPEKLQLSDPDDSTIPPEAIESDDTVKPVKRHFQVK